MWFNKTVPENDPDYKHDYEGSDDMPAHLKSALLGNDVLIPIKNGQLALGTWQGIYLCEHRNYGGNRTVVLTAWEYNLTFNCLHPIPIFSNNFDEFI